MSKLIDVLWSGRDRRKPSDVVARIQAYGRLTPPARGPVRNVTPAPQHPPVTRGGGFRNG